MKLFGIFYISCELKVAMISLWQAHSTSSLRDMMLLYGNVFFIIEEHLVPHMPL